MEYMLYFGDKPDMLYHQMRMKAVLQILGKGYTVSYKDEGIKIKGPEIPETVSKTLTSFQNIKGLDTLVLDNN